VEPNFSEGTQKKIFFQLCCKKLLYEVFHFAYDARESCGGFNSDYKTEKISQIGRGGDPQLKF